MSTRVMAHRAQVSSIQIGAQTHEMRAGGVPSPCQAAALSMAQRNFLF